MKDVIYFEVVAEKWVGNYREFSLSTQNISFRYEETLNQAIEGIEKLRVTLSEAGEYLFSPPVEMFPFVFIDKKFDFDAYWAANEAERASIVLETLQQSVLDMCEKLSLDKAPFEVAYEKLKTGL